MSLETSDLRCESTIGPDSARRRFFSHMIGQVAVTVDELLGHRNYSLSDLPGYSDSRLGLLEPKVAPGQEIQQRNGFVVAQSSHSGCETVAFEICDKKLFMFNRFNGKTSLRTIACEYGREFSIGEKVAFDEVREFFLGLVMLAVCIPANVVEG